jgi:molecular chaperone DnaK (HSP70)
VTRTITRTEFAVLVQDLIQRTFKVCDEAMQQSDLTVRDLDGVILVGGPTRLSIVREAVTHYFQQDPRSDVDPDEVVSMGAAIHAASLVGEAQDAMLLDVTPLDLRIGVAGGLAEPVIERNTPVPIEQTRTFTTFQDHQESVQIRVYQGDHRMAEDNTLLGQFEFSGFEKGPRSEVKIDVTFEIDADGLVNVTASDQATGQQASTQITLSSGLDNERIEEIIQEDVAGRVTTAGSADLVAAPNVSDQSVAEAESATPETASSPPQLEEPPEEPSLFGDGSTDFSLGRPDDLVDLSEVEGPDLDLMDDDELIQLAAEPIAPHDVISLDTPVDLPEEDDGFFETSGDDLSAPDLDITETTTEEDK